MHFWTMLGNDNDADHESLHLVLAWLGTGVCGNEGRVMHTWQGEQFKMARTPHAAQHAAHGQHCKDRRPIVFIAEPAVKSPLHSKPLPGLCQFKTIAEHGRTFHFQYDFDIYRYGNIIVKLMHRRSRMHCICLSLSLNHPAQNDRLNCTHMGITLLSEGHSHAPWKDASGCAKQDAAYPRKLRGGTV